MTSIWNIYEIFERVASLLFKPFSVHVVTDLLDVVSILEISCFHYTINCSDIFFCCCFDHNVSVNELSIMVQIGIIASWLKGDSAQLAGTVEYSDCISAECPDMTLNNQMELWGMRSTPSAPLLFDPLWPRVVATERVISMGQIELTFKLNANKWLMLNWIVRNRSVWSCYCG